MVQTREEKNEYNRLYYQKNKERRQKQIKEYNKKNKEKQMEYRREWNKKNKEKIAGYDKKYQQGNPYMSKKNKWIHMGIKLKPNEDWESVYLFYITCEYCEQCGVRLTTEQKITKTRRTLDHDHSTGFIRNILCHSCNVKRG